ncbi:hypothetical protein AB0J21_24465 [Streptomyces sp. NPDC049954]|uniref:hypothetical protein n=1 Tax=Streptomyces sp. NPDC049954 TaxID=3155779 RepID=UPI0034171028
MAATKGSSPRPDRRHAAAGSLDHRRAPATARTRSRGDEDLFSWPFALPVLGVALVGMGGDPVWSAGGDLFPGGAFVLAVLLGAAWPFLLLALVRCVPHGRRLPGTVLSAAGLFLVTGLAGTIRAPAGRHPGPPTDTYQDFPWLWPTGGGATATAVAAMVAVAPRRDGGEKRAQG